jgi:predicted flap endonuclease-1-like 5' DNA nuclease
MSRANPNIVMPARLTDALKEKDAKSAAATPPVESARKDEPRAPRDDVEGDDLKRIRGVGVLIEKRLNALGVTRYSDVANWTSGDIDRISQTLDFKGRIERENWVEQARILSSGGHTEFSRRVDRGDVESSRDPEET